MANQRHLDHAPILEALIDFQFEQLTDIDLSALAVELSQGFQTEISDLFVTMLELKIEKNASPQAATSANTVGKRIDVPSLHRVIQLRNNGFTFSRLAPYDTWEEIVSAALSLWSIYASHAGSEKMRRIAIRYINVLQLPLPLENFDKYLTSPPPIPKELQQGVSAFLTRVVCPQKEDVLTITQSLEGELEDGKAIKIILDIEVANEGKYDLQDINSLARVLERLRECKNDAFFALLTEDALEIYK